MIEIVNRNPSGMFDAEEPWVRLTEINDSLVIQQATPVLGAIGIKSFNLEYEGNLLAIFRYSIDEGLNWSETLDLNLENLQRINLKRSHWFMVEITLVNQPYMMNQLELSGNNLVLGPDGSPKSLYVESNTTWTVEESDQGGDTPEPSSSNESFFKAITFELEFNKPAIPEFYKDFNYSKFIPYYNHFCIDWTVNVMRKLYQKGIVPKYIERGSNLDWYKSEQEDEAVILCDDRWEDEDYINFWYFITYINALRIWAVDVLEDMLWNPRILHAWLESKGLILGSDIHMDELYYLMTYFYDEMMRRGTMSSFDRSRNLSGEFAEAFVRGEFIRLINGESTDEIVRALIPSSEQGWVVGYSSPCGYANTDYLVNFTKAWENKISDLSKYPLYNGSNIAFDDNGAIIIRGGSDVYSGIGLGDPDMRVPIDPSKDYFFLVRFSCEQPFDLRTGCYVYNNVDDQISLEDLEGNDQNYFIDEKTFQGTNGDVLFFGEVRSNGTFIRKGQLDGVVNVLKFKDNQTAFYAMPFFVARSSSNLIIKEVRFGLLADRDTYLLDVAELYLVVKNNNPEYDRDSLKDEISNKLLPIGVYLTLDSIESVNLSVEPIFISFPQSGGVEMVSLTLNGDFEWSAQADHNFFQINPSRGSGSSVIRVIAEENLSKETLIDHINVRSGTSTVTVIATQEAMRLVFELTSTQDIVVSSEGSSFRISGTSNCEGIKINSIPDWVEISELRVNGEAVSGWDGNESYQIEGDPGAEGPYSFELELQASENLDTAMRNATISLSGWNGSQEIRQQSVRIIQWGASSINVSPLQVTIPSSGDSQEVTIETTGSWTAFEI